MAIEIKLKNSEGAVKKYTRPDASVEEMENFWDFQDEIVKVVNAGKSTRKDINDMQVDYLVGVFKEHDAFTREEFKAGVTAKTIKPTLISVFSQISPEDYEKEDKEKK